MKSVIMRKRKKRRYNDGIAKFYEKKDERRNVKSLDDLKYLGFLYFDEKSKRQEDIEFAEQHGNQLTLKISTQDDGNMDSHRNVVIGNVIYSIINIDMDKEESELYFYLEEVRKIVE